MRILLLLLLLLPAALLPQAGTAAPPADPLYGRQIVIDAEAGAMVKTAADDLALWLGKMTGTPFTVATTPTAPPAGAIYLVRATSPLASETERARLKGKGLEAFLIVGTPTRLKIIANDMRGLSHGVYFYLEQLGMRWLLPGPNWTIVPSRANVTLTIDRLVAPAFWARSWAGSGGFYSNLFGRQYTGSADRKKGIADLEIDAMAWQRRLRLGGQPLGKAMGEGFIADRTITPILEAHPEYLAKIDGAHTPLYIPAKGGDYLLDPATQRYVRATPAGTGTHNLNIIAKLNVGNPDAVKLFADWILKGFRARRAAPGGYAFQTVSVEPADGGGEGNNVEELKAAGIGDGSPSDQQFYVANHIARLVRQEFPDASVIMLAYATRSDPPTFPLEPNVIVQPALGLRMGRKTAGLNMDEWLSLWATKASTMALYTYWSIPDWTHDEPTFNYLEVAKQLRDWHGKHITGLNAETTWSAGAMGLGHYVAAHVMWDPTLDDRALIAEWYDKAFGPAKAPMQRMLERWARSYRPLSAELAQSYRDIAEAARLATENAAVTARVDDFARYLHYLRLRNEFLSAGDAADKNRRASALAEYVFDIHDSYMVHTTRTFDLLAYRGYPALMQEFYRHGAGRLPGDPPDGPGWARVQPLTHDDVAALIADGLKSYPTPDFTMQAYSAPLAPVAPLTWKAPAGDPWGPELLLIGELQADVRLLPGLAALPLRVSRLVDMKITIADAAGKTVATRAVTAAPLPRNEALRTWEELSIPLAPGQYTVTCSPTGGRARGNFALQTWKGVPFVLRSFLSPKGVGAPKLYFYVPRGLKTIAIYFPLSNRAGGFETPVYRPDGTRATVTVMDGGKVMLAPVPTGHDGKIWWMDRLINPDFPIETLNVPQAFALEPQVLLVPGDALPKPAGVK